MRKHLALIPLIGLLGLSLGAANPRQAPPDISGTWEFTFDFTSHMTKGGKKGAPIVITKNASKRVTFVLEQQGENLTVTCCEPEEKVTGAVRGDEVSFEREVSRDGKIQKIVYHGAIETPTKMSGTLKTIGDTDQIDHKWTAIKQDH